MIKFIKKNHQLVFWLALGLLIRLLLMPFLAHDDFFLVYGRVTNVFLGEANLWAYGQPLFNLYHSLGFVLIKLFTPAKDILAVFLDQDLANPQTLKVIFLGKIPFVVFEYLCLFLLLKFFKKTDWLRITIFWLFNPVNLYVLYAFGRFESVVVFMLLWFFWLLKKKKMGWAALVFGFLILTRTFFVIFIPLYSLFMGNNFKEKFRYTFLGLAPFLLWYFYNEIFLARPELAAIFQEGKHGSYFFASQIDIGLGHKIYLFFLGYALIWLFAWFSKKAKNFDLGNFLRCSLGILIVYYATSFFHPQYFAWVIPFLAFLVIRPEYKKITWLLVLLLLPMLLFWDNFTTLGLLKPVAGFFNDFSAVGFINRFFPSVNFLNLIRTFFSAVGFYLLWLVFKEKKDVFKNN
jgi:hypothetical protein